MENLLFQANAIVTKICTEQDIFITNLLCSMRDTYTVSNRGNTQWMDRQLKFSPLKKDVFEVSLS